jgi:16S rRNA (cytidine1402-2'-O)-methyltransferase
VQATLVLYESPKRIDKLLASCCAVMGEDREVAVCRELTKKFEEVRRAPLGRIDEALADMPRKGEIVVLIDRGTGAVTDADLETALRAAWKRQSVKDAAHQVAEALNLPRREVYQAALALAKTNERRAVLSCGSGSRRHRARLRGHRPQSARPPMARKGGRDRPDPR